MSGLFRAKRIGDRLKAARLIVELAEIAIQEADEPDTLAYLLHPDRLARKDLTQIHRPFLKQMRTIRHGGRPVVKGIPDLR